MNVILSRIAGSVVAVLAAAAPLASLAYTAEGAPNGTFAVFTADSAAPPPTATSVIGVVSDHLCRRPWDAPATDAEALAPVEAKARALGANGLVDVRFDRHRTDLKSICWQKVTVTGTAVVLGGAPGR
jgi:hypothetical protein